MPIILWVLVGLVVIDVLLSAVLFVAYKRNPNSDRNTVGHALRDNDSAAATLRAVK